MKIGRSDIIQIVAIGSADSQEKISYPKWIEFIEDHKDYFLWYEDTEDGIQSRTTLDTVPDWAKEGILYRLNKTCAYSTSKIVKNSFDLIIRYFKNEGIVKIDIEKKMKKEVANVLLKMAKHIDGKIIINDKKELNNIEQLS